MDEQNVNEFFLTDEQMRAMGAAMQSAARAGQALAETLNAVFQPMMQELLRVISRFYWQLRAVHAVPRQYCNTMMQRKLRCVIRQVRQH